MREEALFVLRRFARDLPWLTAIVVVLAVGFMVVPTLIDRRPFEESLRFGAGLGIGMVAIVPLIWIRFRVIRELGGRRTALAFLMGAVWAAVVILLALPFLDSLEAAG